MELHRPKRPRSVWSFWFASRRDHELECDTASMERWTQPAYCAELQPRYNNIPLVTSQMRVSRSPNEINLLPSGKYISIQIKSVVTSVFRTGCFSVNE